LTHPTPDFSNISQISVQNFVTMTAILVEYYRKKHWKFMQKYVKMV